MHIRAGQEPQFHSPHIRQRSSSLVHRGSCNSRYTQNHLLLNFMRSVWRLVTVEDAHACGRDVAVSDGDGASLNGGVQLDDVVLE